jgi:hypothetical protein
VELILPPEAEKLSAAPGRASSQHERLPATSG